MSVIITGIIIEVILLIGLIFWIKRYKSKQNRQPSLSKKVIKNLKL